jgi:hypothetical protein
LASGPRARKVVGVTGGIDDLYAVCGAKHDAMDQIARIVRDDSGIDWGHVVDLSTPNLLKVASWERGTWTVPELPEVPSHLKRSMVGSVGSSGLSVGLRTRQPVGDRAAAAAGGIGGRYAVGTVLGSNSVPHTRTPTTKAQT